MALSSWTILMVGTLLVVLPGSDAQQPTTQSPPRPGEWCYYNANASMCMAMELKIIGMVQQLSIADIRPRNIKTAFPITFDFLPQRITSISSKSRAAVMAGIVVLRWNDDRVKWLPGQFKGIQKVLVSPKRIWYPYVATYNSDVPLANKYSKTKAVVDFKGRVRLSPRVRLLARCEAEYKKFPFDTMTCEIVFGSMEYNSYGIDLRVLWARREISTDHMLVTHGWKVNSMTMRRTVDNNTVDNENFTTVTLSFLLQRHSGYARVLLFYPGVLIALSILVVFLLPPGSQVKLIVGSLTVIAHLLLFSELQKFIPDDADSIPAVGNFLGFSMFLSVFSLFLSAALLSMSATRSVNERELPSIMKTVLLGAWTRYLLVSLPADLGTSNEPRLEMKKETPANQPQTPAQMTSDTDSLVEVLDELERGSRARRSGAAAEWQAAAAVLDRIALVVYLLAMIIACSVILSQH